jgi:putative DNA primase/helicase
MDAALRQAKSDLRVRVSVDAWDTDPHLLGVKNGVVDLRTGELLKGRPELRITRCAPVDYTPGAYSKRWIDFIDFATRGDKELQEFVQRLCGYTITGLSHLDILPLVHGHSGSGKNTFVEAIVKALGTSQLSWPMDSSILADKEGHANPADLYHWAELRGRRMVWADELPDGERVKENSIKKLTGSSEISARSPGEKPFTFQSQAKLWITTNHKPIITDDAMWRRLVPIPWDNVPENPDPSLKDYLFDPEGGLGAVLAWCIEGAVKFLDPTTGGLGFSKVVHDASETYRRSEDRIGIFFNEETVEVPGAETRLKDIFYLYRSWSEERGERPMTYIAFQRKIVERKELEIIGEGTRAMLIGREMGVKTPRSSASIDVLAASGGYDINFNNLLDKGFNR